MALISWDFTTAVCSTRHELKSSKLSHRDFPGTLVSSSEQESGADFLFLVTLVFLQCCSPSANRCLWWTRVSVHWFVLLSRSQKLFTEPCNPLVLYPWRKKVYAQWNSGLQIKCVAVHVHLYDTCGSFWCFLHARCPGKRKRHHLLMHSKIILKNAISVAVMLRNTTAGLSACKVNCVCFVLSYTLFII